MNPDDFKGNRGGPAFPLPLGTANISEPEQSGGMSLRDYFAAKAMQAICAHHDTWGLGDNGIASRAYEMADLMLAAREAA